MWRSSYVRVFVSIANATPVGAIANESMSPRPPPRQRMTQPPPLSLKRREHVPDLLLGASAYATATAA